ncbi:tyrosine-type recombinase/integrase [soil metagenome]
MPNLPLQAPSSPSIFTCCPATRTSMREFFSSHLRCSNTRRAYREAVRQFSSFCTECNIEDLGQVQTSHIRAFMDWQRRFHSEATIRQRLSALRTLFDWMVVSQILSLNPAQAVRGPKHRRSRKIAPVLRADEIRILLDAIDAKSLPGLRDRALIGLIVYTSARVGTVLSMTVEDFYIHGHSSWAQFQEGGVTERAIISHHNLNHYLQEYIRAAGIGDDLAGPLFRTTRGRSAELTERPMLQPDAWRVLRRRALAAGIMTNVRCDSFRARCAATS